MKPINRLVLAFVCLAILNLDVDVQAEDYTYGTNDNGSITIAGYTGPGGDVKIPETIDGLPVTAIGRSVFPWWTKLNSVTIPASVTSISWFWLVGRPLGVTMEGHSSLTAIMVDALNPAYSSVDGALLDKNQSTLIKCPSGKAGTYTIPNSVTNIERAAFYGCTGLTSITIPNSVTSIGVSAFYGCTALTGVRIPDSVNNIEAGVFEYCGKLSGVTIPDSVTNIHGSAFAECTSLTTLTMGKSVNRIGSQAFSRCTGLTNVTIPPNVNNIELMAFFGCTGLTAIEVDARNPAYSSVDGILFDQSLTTLLTFPAGKAGSYTIPNGVTTIGESAFGGCIGLTTVTVPGSVSKLPRSAFAQCTSLTSIMIPNSVTSIESWAFYGCTGLTNVTLGNGIKDIGACAFSGCTLLTNLTIPDSVTKIGESAFASCSGLTAITIPKGVTSIGGRVFCQCTTLTSITVDSLNPVYSSVDGVLFDKNQASLIQWPGGKTGSFAVPNSVTTIGERAFVSCTGLTTLTLGDGVTSIGAYAFSGCTRLTNLTIPGSTIYIGEEAFSDCTRLTAITVDALNSRYSSVDGVLFDKSRSTLIRCPEGRAGSFTIPSSVAGIGEMAFFGCTRLSAIEVDALNTIYASVDGVLLDKSRSTLIRYPEGKAGTSYSIPKGVICIWDLAFYCCTRLTDVTIPASVTAMSDSAFYGCRLERVNFCGNAPEAAYLPWYVAEFDKVCYLPGTAGWPSTFAGRPTSLWSLGSPLILNGSEGIRANAFGFRISWATNSPVVVEASATLDNPAWTAVSTNNLTDGWSDFRDPQWTNYPSRFYRLRSL